MIIKEIIGGLMESSKATLTLERICDMATLSQDSVELLSNILGMNTEELYRTDVVMIGKVTSEENRILPVSQIPDS